MKLFDALYDLAFILQDFVRSTATGGTTSTLIDTVARFEGDDFFDNGTLFIRSGNLADKALVISNWTLFGPNQTFAFATQGSSVAAGDIYAAIPKDFPKGLLVESINQALIDIGKLPKTDITLDTVTAQEEYTLPSDVENIKRVEIAHSLVTPFNYVPNYNWFEREGKLVFHTDYEPKTNGYAIRLSYNEPQTEKSADSDVIDDLIDRELLRWTAAVFALRWRMIRNPEEVANRLNEALMNQLKYMHKKPKKFKRDPIFSRYY
jgi:hypothetical protein